jgi:hypothetical protein
MGVVVVATVLLRWEGRRWWCACGQWAPWIGDARGPHTSQHLFDPYSFTHVQHGLLLWGLLAVLAPRLALGWRFVLAVLIECAWEVFENTDFVIDRYRAATVALGYQGDSIANSLGDIFSSAIGFWLARSLGWGRSLVVFLLIELLMLVCLRDSLVLNVVMLVYPIEAIRTWQMGG